MHANLPITRTRGWRAASVLLVLSTLPLLSSCRRAVEPPAPEIRPVRVITIAKGVGGDTITLVGTVQAQAEINLSFRIDGRLIERNVNVGDVVRPGQVIARLDSENEASTATSARAQLAEARLNYERMRDLVAENAVSRATFDQAETLLKTATSQATLAENRLRYTRLVSDVAGVVTAQGAEPGEIVGAGRTIVQVARQGGRDAVFDVPARIKDSAPANTPITVLLTSNPSVTTTGVVREVSPRADPVTGTFRVRVGLPNPPAVMRLGSTVTGRMKLAATAGVEIPAAALFRSDGQAAVWVVDAKTGTVALRNIDVRGSDAARVEVASGLNPGDIVVTAGVQALRPGQKVRLPET